MNGNSILFQDALLNSDLELLKTIPKSDLHNHAPLGSRLKDFSSAIGSEIPSPPSAMQNIAEMNEYIINNLRSLIVNPDGFKTSIALALRQAKMDGITKLEMSLDCQFVTLFPDKEIGLINFLKQISKSEAPEIQFNPEIGLSRNLDIAEAENWIYPCIESGYFKSIDLYGEELIKDATLYKNIYKVAKNHNLKLKSHTGEFGNAESVRYTVETLELDEVQHGISAADSKDVMKWLRNNNIRLNVCPSSNIRLNRVQNMEQHPCRILADNGIIITINSDDIMIFDQSISDEFFNLYNAKLFSATELNVLRINGLQ